MRKGLVLPDKVEVGLCDADARGLSLDYIAQSPRWTYISYTNSGSEVSCLASPSLMCARRQSIRLDSHFSYFLVSIIKMLGTSFFSIIISASGSDIYYICILSASMFMRSSCTQNIKEKYWERISV